MHKWRRRWDRFTVFAIAACAIAFVLANTLANTSVRSQPALDSDLPPAQVHPLPEFLARWQDAAKGDYFDQVEPTSLGYLVWSKFPVKVFIEKSQDTSNSSANQRFKAWTEAARKAIAEWNVYFPLQEIPDRDTADILILRSQPEREIKLNPDTGLYDIPRAIAAQTNYEFYLIENPTVIAMRMEVQVSPNFAGVSLLATVRHELGHALGIWGHSPKPRDALFFSQVNNPPAISPRDINTLKKIYQQPTRLGWEIQ